MNFLDKNDNDEAWFNIDVEINNVTPMQVRSNVLSYSHALAKRLHKSKVSINTFVLSFHVRIGNQPSRNIFFRVSRNELEKVFSLGGDRPEDMGELKNVLFDELFVE